MRETMRRPVVALAVLGLLLASCSSEERVFEFAEDDLCDWITEEEVTDFARQAYEAVGVDWNGSATLTKEDWFEDPIEYECEWSLSGSGFEGGLIYVYTHPVSRSTEAVTAYADLSVPYIPLDGTVAEHPEFDEEVMIGNHAFGRYAFWVPTSDQQLVLSVALGADIELEGYRFEVPLFVVANGFLEAMHWTS